MCLNRGPLPRPCCVLVHARVPAPGAAVASAASARIRSCASEASPNTGTTVMHVYISDAGSARTAKPSVASVWGGVHVSEPGTARTSARGRGSRLELQQRLRGLPLALGHLGP